MEHIATRIKHTLKRSGLTARNLAAMSDVHYTTIYLITKKGEKANPLPAVSNSLDRALTVIEQLLAENTLPLPSSLSQEARQDRLSQLVSEHNNP
jgi:hypothetical protein